MLVIWWEIEVEDFGHREKGVSRKGAKKAGDLLRSNGGTVTLVKGAADHGYASD
jgi:hypothetical protein